MLFRSHYLHQVQQVCDRVGLFVSGKLIAEGNVQALSKKLFSDSPYTIEVGINGSGHEHPGLSEGKFNIGWMNNVLQSVDGIIAVNRKDDLFHISSSRDTTAEISKAVVDSGAVLTHLIRKEYGLDDIYYRYFEGGEDHE